MAAHFSCAEAGSQAYDNGHPEVGDKGLSGIGYFLLREIHDSSPGELFRRDIPRSWIFAILRLRKLYVKSSSPRSSGTKSLSRISKSTPPMFDGDRHRAGPVAAGIGFNNYSRSI